MRADPRFQAAMALRGITDFAAIQVDAWPAGHFGPAEETGQRLCRAVAFIKPSPGDSEWAHPVDGVIALVDLNKLEVLRVDDHGVVPIPPESGNYDVAAAAPLRDDIAPLEITPARGPGLRARRPRAVVAALAGAHRLHAPRGARAQPGRLRGRRPAALDPLPRVALRDGRAVRRSEPEPLLEERLRRRRERRRHARQRRSRAAATASARSSTSTPSSPTPPASRCRSRTRSASTRRTSACSGATSSARRSGRGAPLAPAGDLVVLGDRQLRLRLLLVPLPGRHDRVRGQAHRRALDRRGRPGRTPGARHARRTGPQRDGAPALLQHAPRPRHRRPRERRRRGLDGVAPARARQPATATRSARAAALRARAARRARRVDPASARWWEIVNPSRLHRLGEPIGYRLLPGENTFAFAAAGRLA